MTHDSWHTWLMTHTTHDTLDLWNTRLMTHSTHDTLDSWHTRLMTHYYRDTLASWHTIDSWHTRLMTHYYRDTLDSWHTRLMTHEAHNSLARHTPHWNCWVSLQIHKLLRLTSQNLWTKYVPPTYTFDSKFRMDRGKEVQGRCYCCLLPSAIWSYIETIGVAVIHPWRYILSIRSHFRPSLTRFPSI